jgi:hypothetical protein
MNPEQIKAKSAELAAFYTSLAAGKQLQFHYGETFPIWVDCKPMDAPRLSSDLSYYRVKPEPRRMWETPSPAAFCNNHNARTDRKDEADAWRAKGLNVTEWMEVLP